MEPNWEALEPDRPLGPEDAALYVEPPGRTAKTIADSIRVGRSTVLLVGPRGIGKTTEMQFAAEALRNSDFVVAEVRVSQEDLEQSHWLPPDFAHELLRRAKQSGADIGWNSRDKVYRSNTSRRLVLLIDGLDQPTSDRTFHFVAALRVFPRNIDLVVTAPWSLIYQPHTNSVLRPGEFLLDMQPYVDFANSESFLYSIVERRLGIEEIPVEAKTAIDLAAAWSGGIPQLLLQILHQAATSARLRSESWPTVEDVESTVAHRVAAIRRQFQPGDKSDLRTTDGTDGAELALPNKLRYLDQCLLLQSTSGAETRLSLHPLARAAVRTSRENGHSAPVARVLEGTLPEWAVPTRPASIALQALHIGQYRGVSDVRLDGLGRVNLLVGVNNAGKTSVLEALHILAHRSDPRGLFDAVHQRARGRSSEDSWLFGQLPVPFRLTATMEGTDVTVEGNASTDADSDEDRARYLGSLRITSGDQSSVTDFRIAQRRETRVVGRTEWFVPSVLHSPFAASDKDRLLDHHAKSVESGTHDKIVKFLQDNVDADIRSIEFVSENERFLVAHRKFEKPVDLASFGDGLQRIYRIGLLFAAARHGIVLVDEFENAIHTSVLTNLTTFVHELAREFNVQVFLTTHSKETIDAFVFDEHVDDVVAYGLYRHPHGIRVARYGGRKLQAAIDAIDLDIRWPP